MVNAVNVAEWIWIFFHARIQKIYPPVVGILGPGNQGKEVKSDWFHRATGRWIPVEMLPS
jgi:hypothetical protein